ncbi:MAG: nuclear transport factor 2 family protein [Hyphomonadaceae bacterium JAD_PAG50586_4]|nr:MAG: nuclear transport factor 2 family protein [Hyphomonadaceae bacterium JAD_PAG50586_4]
MSAVEVVQRQLEAYNAQNMDAFLATYALDCQICDLNGAVTQNGREDIRARYSAMFAQFPENKARLVNRISLGDVVIDHEDVVRGPNGPRLEAIAIYTVKNGLIARVDFVK